MGQRSPEATLEEAVGLAEAIDLETAAGHIIPIQAIKPSTYFGTGKVAEIGAVLRTEKADLAFVDADLSPVQQRNLEREWHVKVIDRTGLILEIFADRARTREGRLQVELAHLTYQRSRLVRSWTHLERQRGGLGFVGGPGETQIEADRRILQQKITRLEKDLDKVKRTRELHRVKRHKAPHPVVALVGYTNAGKSTLFNALTGASVEAQDLLFATLDPTMRVVRLPHGADAILSDTVGFIADLPTQLVAAFRATLEEVMFADVILHVRDISHPDTAVQAKDVAETLDLLGIDIETDRRVIEVWNKIDLVSDLGRVGDAAPISALTGQGLDQLLLNIEERLSEYAQTYRVAVPASDGKLVAWLYDRVEVLERQDRTGSEAGDDAFVELSLRVPPERADHFRAKAGPYIVQAD
ncbi:MAG: GTPase HflX [Pseudomonadota bacterium]